MAFVRYVVYAVRQQRIHVVSRNVYSLYCVVKSQLENKDELMAEDAAHLNQLFDSWTLQQGDHQSGFFIVFLRIHFSIKLRWGNPGFKKCLFIVLCCEVTA